MASSFFERIDALAEEVGHGHLTGKVEVDQVYAHYQHEGLDLDHPRGGQAKYLEQPLYAKHRDYLAGVARATLEPGGPDRAMADAMEDLSGQVSTHAPVEFGDLRKSGHPSVLSDGATVYDRPPEVHRLSEEELRAKHRRGL